MRPEKVNHSLVLQGRELSYAGPGRGAWSIDVSDLVAIGELTTQDGPFEDDHFLVFVPRNQAWREVALDVVGVSDTLADLSKELGEKLELSLANSTDFSSRVLWPPELRDAPLFSFVTRRGETFRGRLREKIVGCLVDRTLSPPIRAAQQGSASSTSR